MCYRRTQTAVATYFFTVNLVNRKSDLLVQEIAALREITRIIKHAHPFVIEAMVVLPGHLRAIWKLPEGDADYPMRWSLIKPGFSRGLEKIESVSATRLSKR
jgi:putative transposase